MKRKCIIIVGCLLLLVGMVFLRVKYMQPHGEKNGKEQQEKIAENGTLYNVWIMDGHDRVLHAYIEGEEHSFVLRETIGALSDVVADLELLDGVVQKITLKEETISGKVLSVDEKQIEIDGYGLLPIGTGYKVYQTYDGIGQLTAKNVLVGYEDAEFVVADGKVCATLLRKEQELSSIRVLLKTTGFEDIYHKQVKLQSDQAVTISCGKNSKKYKAGETITITGEQEWLKKGKRIVIRAEGEDSTLKLMSIKRGYGNPCYRGQIEIARVKGKGLLIVNELPLEQYLYAVIGSEMPVSYGAEALKVQAVCARSYAYKQVMYNGCGQYGAHVDDSVSYQVYNNSKETKETVQAVNDTKGQVLEYKGEVITAYYFSTSCGCTASAEEVWQGAGAPYLMGRIQNKDEQVKDLSKEKAFRSFLTDMDFETFDQDFSWYRWKTTVSGEQLGKQIAENIRERFEANEELILTKQRDDSYVSKSIDSIGEVKDVKVVERGKSGVLRSVEITGTKATIKVITEYNIRTLLGPKGTIIYRGDDSQIEGMEMLPSGFFYVEHKNDKFTFVGGGYGHGVGMSQNGAKAMVDLGYSYDEILTHYYKGTQLAMAPNF